MSYPFERQPIDAEIKERVRKSIQDANVAIYRNQPRIAAGALECALQAIRECKPPAVDIAQPCLPPLLFDESDAA